MKLSELSKKLKSKGSTLSTRQPCEKRNLLDSLQLNVTADPQSYQFIFKLGGQLISTADSDADAIYTQQLEEFEQKHPRDFHSRPATW